jgi:hypothetical protein
MLLPLLAACGAEATTNEGMPPAADVAALPAAEVPGRVLAACHGDVLGLERFIASVTLPDGSQVKAFGHLPDKLRVQLPSGEVHLYHDGRTVRLGDTPTELPADAALRLRALHSLLDVVGLGPLHRAIGCQRTGERTFSLLQPAAEPWLLTLQPGSLLVERLHGPAGAVRVIEHGRTSTTWIIRTAEVEPLGACAVRFDEWDYPWDASAFALTRKRPAGSAVHVMGAEARPETPQLEERARALRWLVLDDPLSWEGRAAAVQEHVRMLQEGQQELAGFAGLLSEGERARLVVPFRPEKGGARFEPPVGWDVRDVPAGRGLTVFPRSGDLAQRAADGERLLRAALQAQGLDADGPVLVQPYLHLDKGPPTEAALAALVVRVSVAVK